MKSEKTIVCAKWGSAPYNAEDINCLYRAVKRHLSDFRFVVFTDEGGGLEPAIEARNIEDLTFAPELRGIWWKLAVLHPDAKLSGQCLFLDLDTIVVGNLDCFFSYPGKFCIIKNWIKWTRRIFRAYPKRFASAVYRYEAGAHPEVAELFMKNPAHAMNESNFKSEQAFMQHAIGVENVNWWPREWVESYKNTLRPPFPLNWVMPPKIPARAKLVCLSGEPKIREAIAEGYKRGWHRHILPCAELKKHWY